MSIDIDDLYYELLAHRGHQVEVVGYGHPDNPANMALECVTCGCVLLDADKPPHLAILADGEVVEVLEVAHDESGDVTAYLTERGFVLDALVAFESKHPLTRQDFIEALGTTGSRGGHNMWLVYQQGLTQD